MKKLLLKSLVAIWMLLSMQFALAAQLPVLTNGHSNGFAAVSVGNTQADIPFTVDHYDNMIIRAIAPVNGARMSVVDGNGQTVIPEGDPRIGFVSGSERNPPLPGGIFLVERIDMPDNGNWSLRFTFPPAAEKAAIMTTIMFDSQYQVGIMTDKVDYLVGEQGVIGFLALDHGNAATGLSPSATITATNVGSPPLTLLLHDDGLDGDGQANDGLYSAVFTPSATGSFLISGSVSFTSGAGTVSRTSETTINVVNPRVSVLNKTITPVLGAGGCIKGIDVTLELEVLEEGFYILSGKMTGSNDSVLQTGQMEYLLAGSQTATFHFEAEEIEQHIGNASSFSIDYINGFLSDPMLGEVPAFVLAGVGSYSGGSLCLPPISIEKALETTEVMQSVGSHSYISDLIFSFPVTVNKAGKYSISYSVVGPNAEHIESVMMDQFLQVGRNVISATIPGEKFQQVNGPYRVVSVLVVGQGSSAIVTSLGETKAYTKDQFNSQPPLPPSSDTPITATSLITTGAYTLENGNVYVWGFRGSAQQGNGKMVVASNEAPAKVDTLSNVKTLTGGAYHLIALDGNGDIYGWGQSGYGETGCAPTKSIYVETPCKVLENGVQVAAGEYFSIALDKDGQVWTWGHNLYGQLGTGVKGTKYNTKTPQAVDLQGETARLIGAAYEGAFAVTEEGHVWAWGDNEASGLGIKGSNYGVQQIIPTPTHIANLDAYAKDITYIAGGNGWGEALLKDGTVIGWGLHAALGQSTTKTHISSPEPVQIMTDVKQLFARYVGSFALDTSGKLYTWGQTGGSAFKMIYGETPTLRHATSGIVTAIGGGKEHLFYQTDNGKLYGVGYNDLYKLNQSKCCAPTIDWPGIEIRIP